MELNDEVYQYYSKLLAMKARRPDASDSDPRASGDDEEEDDIENRYKIIVPDAVDRFPVIRKLWNEVLHHRAHRVDTSEKRNTFKYLF